jgi:hypothetical protein
MNPALPAGRLHVVGDVQVDGGPLRVNGNVNATGFFYSSDERLKTEIETAPGIKELSKIRGVHFTWRSSGKSGNGVIAQEVAKVFPEMVRVDSTTGLQSVSYMQLIGPLIESVKDLKKQNDELETKILSLETKLKNLENHDHR